MQALKGNIYMLKNTKDLGATCNNQVCFITLRCKG